MAVRPYKDKKGNITPGKWVVDYYPHGQKGKKVIRVIEGEGGDAREYEMEVRRMHKPGDNLYPPTDFIQVWR